MGDTVKDLLICARVAPLGLRWLAPLVGGVFMLGLGAFTRLNARRIRLTSYWHTSDTTLTRVGPGGRPSLRSGSNKVWTTWPQSPHARSNAEP